MFQKNSINLYIYRNSRKNILKIGIFGIEFPVLDAKLKSNSEIQTFQSIFSGNSLLYKTMFKKENSINLYK